MKNYGKEIEKYTIITVYEVMIDRSMIGVAGQDLLTMAKAKGGKEMSVDFDGDENDVDMIVSATKNGAYIKVRYQTVKTVEEAVIDTTKGEYEDEWNAYFAEMEDEDIF